MQLRMLTLITHIILTKIAQLPIIPRKNNLCKKNTISIRWWVCVNWIFWTRLWATSNKLYACCRLFFGHFNVFCSIVAFAASVGIRECTEARFITFIMQTCSFYRRFLILITVTLSDFFFGGLQVCSPFHLLVASVHNVFAKWFVFHSCIW